MIPKERKRYKGIDNLRDKGVRNFHLNPADFPGLSFEKASLGKIRLDQNDGTDIPLSEIPDILTGKDADTVDGFHHDQSLLKNTTPEFQNVKLKTLTGFGQLLYSQSNGELLQTPRLLWDSLNQLLDINVNKTGYANYLMKLRNTAGSVLDPGSVIFQLESGDASASFYIYHGAQEGNVQMWLSSNMTAGELGFHAGGTTGIEILPSPTTGAGQVCFGGWQNPGSMYCFNTTNFWENNGDLLVLRKSNDSVPFRIMNNGRLQILQDSDISCSIEAPNQAGWYLQVDGVGQDDWSVYNNYGNLWIYNNTDGREGLRIDGDGNINFGQNKMYLDHANGRLGIGTISPIAKLHSVGGEIVTEFNNATIALGYSTTGAYPHFIHTRHNSANYLNSIDFYVSDGTEAGVFPTNAIHIITLQSANAGISRVGVGVTEPTAMLDINSDILRLRTSKTPASAGASGNAGDICWDSNYVYVCVATNTWKRVAIATW